MRRLLFGRFVGRIAGVVLTACIAGLLGGVLRVVVVSRAAQISNSAKIDRLGGQIADLQRSNETLLHDNDVLRQQVIGLGAVPAVPPPTTTPSSPPAGPTTTTTRRAPTTTASTRPPSSSTPPTTLSTAPPAPVTTSTTLPTTTTRPPSTTTTRPGCVVQVGPVCA